MPPTFHVGARFARETVGAARALPGPVRARPAALVAATIGIGIRGQYI